MGGHVRTHLEADAVAQTHLEQCLGNAAVAHGAGGGDQDVYKRQPA